MTETRDFSGVTRIEVINSRGRVFTQYYKPHTAIVQIQDDGRTIKVFAGEPTQWEEVQDAGNF